MSYPEVIYLKAEYQELENLLGVKGADMWFNGFSGYRNVRENVTYPEVLEALNKVETLNSEP